MDDEALVQAMDRIRAGFIKKEVDTRRRNTIETNEKMKKIMDAWMGCTAEDIFHQWKHVVECLKEEKAILAKREERERLRLQNEENEKLRMAQLELSLWISEWDEFNDKAYWRHSRTGETTFVEPTIQSMLNQGWSHPELKQRRLQRSAIGTHKTKKNNKENNVFRGRLEKEAMKAAQNILKLRLDNSLTKSK